ncbi:MAG: DNA primase small subunit domain-containing protein [Thermoplasmata archaeon]
MAKVVQLAAPALDWAREEFAEHYRSVDVPPPPRIARREFAAFPFAAETMMRRHAAFGSVEELRRYLAHDSPRHVYYSTAYYHKPSEPTMDRKEWIGADLIFDLDADHLRGAEALGYAGQLELVKRRLRSLIDDFLVGDFGVDATSAQIVFSGGRGYHVHVREPRFLPMSSPERRELVEYLSGTGFDPLRAIRSAREASFTSGEDADPSRARATRFLPPADAPGWTGRMARSVLALFERWDAEGVDATRAEIETMGFPKAKAKRWAGLLVTDRGARRILDDPQRALPTATLPDELLEAVLRQAEIVVQGETDAPVTTDIHRLIRLPGSLHGGTGFRVTPIALDDIEAFEPLRDAVLPNSEERSVAVTYRTEAHYPFPEGAIHATDGGTDVLPTPLALFLVLRGEAELRLAQG